jgi:hypothetical protein
VVIDLFPTVCARKVPYADGLQGYLYALEKDLTDLESRPSVNTPYDSGVFVQVLGHFEQGFKKDFPTNVDVQKEVSKWITAYRLRGLSWNTRQYSGSNLKFVLEWTRAWLNMAYVVYGIPKL